MKLLLPRPLLITLAMALTGFSVAQAHDDLPVIDKDGLELRDHSSLRVVYARPGATLEPYKRIALLDCFVAFDEGWLKNYNRTVRGADRRITEEDMERIKREVAEEFRKVFTKELEEEGGYEIVTVAAEDVLVLRPAIINLWPAAPDTRRPGRTTTIVNSAGRMTLYLELYDAKSDQLLAKVIDPRASRGQGGFGLSNSATNKSEADRILRRWADVLRGHLDAAQKTRAEKHDASHQ